MNKYKVWQIALIYSVLGFGSIFALPNSFPTNPAIQIAFGDSLRAANTNIVNDLSSELKNKNVTFTEIELEELDTQQLLNSVDTMDASVSVCSLLRICGQIDKALEGY